MAQTNKSQRGRRCWKDNNRSSFLEYIARTYHKTLIGFAKGCIGKNAYACLEAKDLMQLFYIRVHEKFKLTQSGYVKHGVKYLKGMLRLLNLQAYRKRRRRVLLGLSEEAYQLKTWTTDIQRLQEEQVMELFRQRVSAAHYCVYQLYLDGRAHKEIATQMEMKLNTVSSIIARSKKKLKMIMEE
ncbi:MAG: sigma factor-like helix-turn-helix DNA-binding protein [Bacteroidota bacterium]